MEKLIERPESARPRGRGYFSGMNALFVILLVLGASLHSSTVGSLISVGQLCIWTLIILLSYLLLLRFITGSTIPVKLTHLNVVIIIFLVFQTLELIGHNELGKNHFFQLTLLLGFFTILSLLRWKPESVRIMSGVVSFYFLLLFVGWLLNGFRMHYSGYFADTNSIGGLTFFLLFFPVLSMLLQKQSNRRPNKLSYLPVLVGSGIILASDTRSVVLSGVAAFVTYVIWKRIIKTRFLFSLYFFAVITTILLFTYIYTMSIALPWVNHYNELIMTWTGKSLFSGRQLIWIQLLKVIAQRPFWGYGIGVNANYYVTFDLQAFSSHNLYLQTALETGVVGLVLLIVVLWRVWCHLWNGRLSNDIRLSGAFLIAILIYGAFEVSLTEINLFIGLVQWMIMGFGVSRATSHGRELGTATKR